MDGALLSAPVQVGEESAWDMGSSEVQGGQWQCPVTAPLCPAVGLGQPDTLGMVGLACINVNSGVTPVLCAEPNLNEGARGRRDGAAGKGACHQV